MLVTYINDMEDKAKIIKCVTIGSKGVGKTYLLKSDLIIYVDGRKMKFQSENCLTDDHIVEKYVTIESETFTLQLCDTSGFHKKQRKKLYTDADICLVCFSTCSKKSFKEAQFKWANEIKQYNIPFLLVGLQTDLRYDDTTLNNLRAKGRAPITFREGESLAKNINAVKYIECSTFTQLGVSTVFDEIVNAILNPEEKEKIKHCIIL